MSKYKIVIVENDEDEQEFIKESFDESGLFDVLALLNNGNALMDWLESHRDGLPHIVLSDLNMPGKNGYDIITEMKNNEAYAHIPIVITSTSSTKAFIDKCLAFGANDYLVKPDTFIEYKSFVDKFYKRMKEKGLLPKT